MYMYNLAFTILLICVYCDAHVVVSRSFWSETLRNMQCHHVGHAVSAPSAPIHCQSHDYVKWDTGDGCNCPSCNDVTVDRLHTHILYTFFI